MLRRTAIMRAGGVKPFVKAGVSQRNSYSTFDNAAAYTCDAGSSVTGGKCVMTALATFDQIATNTGNHAPVTPSIPYEMKITADSVTSGPKSFQMKAVYFQDNAGTASAIRNNDQSSTLAVSTGSQPTFTLTPPADCNFVQMIFFSVNAGTVAGTFDDFTLIG